MKLRRISIRNIGLIEEMILPVEKSLILFYGEIRQGKTTILNAVRWACGCEFPEDIIKHGAKEGSIDLDFDGAIVGRSWYRNDKGKIVARPLRFVRAGKAVPNPSFELKRLMNPFLLDQDYLKNMGETERKRFFAETFAVDTTALDTEAMNASRDAQALRAEIKGYGEIDTTTVERVDATALKAELDGIRKSYRDAVTANNAIFDSVSRHNAKVAEHQRAIEERAKRITILAAQLAELQSLQQEQTEWLWDNPAKPAVASVPEPDTTILESRISDAAANNVRADQYDKDMARVKERQAKEAKLAKLEARQREIKAEKVAKLKTVTDTCGIPGLAFNEEGEFTYRGTAAGMLSTSEIMTLSSELSGLAPEGIGVQLVDRGESLGKSIFGFIDRANAEEITILATVVGERPADVPENIGVFVVENGKATK